jgi:hypothetical protein
MKIKHLLKLIALFLITGILVSFTQKEDIVSALKNGNVEKMSKYFDNMVDVSVPGKSNTFSRSQAEMVIKDFFALNKVKNFEVQHSGNNPTSNFIIGTLTTVSGKFRTTVYMREKSDKQYLQGIEFEPIN